MYLRFLILNISLLFILEKGFAQRTLYSLPIDFKVENLSIKQALNAFEERSKIKLSYSDNILPKDLAVSIDIKAVLGPEVLRLILQNTNIEQLLTDNHIVLYIPQNKENTFTVHGYVRDQANGEPLIGATVFDQNQLLGTATNQYGFYSLTLPSDTLKLRISYVGYKNEKTEFFLSIDTLLKVELSAFLELEEVEIIAEKEDDIVQQVQMSDHALSGEQINKIQSNVGGVSDILKTIRLLPGVQVGTDGIGGMHVRGGGPDQNLVLLDGVQVFNPGHIDNLYSVFSTDVINDVSFIKGGFPAQYGGHLSSVMNISMKEGNMKKWSGKVGIGNIGKLTLEGPIIREKVSFITSIRQTILDPVDINTFRRNVNNNIRDLNLRVNINLSKRDRLFFSFNNSRGKSSITFPFNTLFGDGSAEEGDFDEISVVKVNNIYGFRWNHLINNQMFLSTSIQYTKYNFTSEAERRNVNYTSWGGLLFHNSGYQYEAGNHRWVLSSNLEYRPNTTHLLKMGFHGNLASYKFGSSYYSYIDSFPQAPGEVFTTALPNEEARVYIEDNINSSNGFSHNVGLHLSGVRTQEDSYYSSVEPRLSSRYTLNDNLALKASYAWMKQYIHLITTNTTLLDYWVPTTDFLPPQTSHQIATGAAATFFDDALELTFEAYYKKMNGLISLKESFGVIDGENWTDFVESQGEGWAKGVEFMVYKKRGKYTSWASYRLSSSNRRFNEINEGEKFPYKYDSRHNVKVTFQYTKGPIQKRKKTVLRNFQADWVYRTGNAMTAITNLYPWASINVTDSQLELHNVGVQGTGTTSFYSGVHNLNILATYSDRNAVRLPAFHELNFSIEMVKFLKKDNRRRVWRFGLTNVYGRVNPIGVEPSVDGGASYSVGLLTNTNKSDRLQYVAAGNLGARPFINYEFQF